MTIVERYRNDPVYRERVLAQGRKFYHSRTPEQRAVKREKVNAYHRKRRATPEINLRLIEDQRRYRERWRIAVLIRHARSRCRKNGIEFDAVYMQSIKYLKPSHCPCCGVGLSYGFSGKAGKPPNNGPSLDRIDPTKGYIHGNVEIICWRCNALKRDATLPELQEIVAYMEARL
jgi:hypothetical protein